MFFLPVRMSKKCKWKKKSNSFSTKEKTNERRRWLLKDSCFFLNCCFWLFHFVLFLVAFLICCLMALDQMDDWIISLTLRLKPERRCRWWSEVWIEVRCSSRLVIEMKEGTEMYKKNHRVIIEINILLPIFSLHCCFFSFFTLISWLPDLISFSSLSSLHSDLRWKW